MTRSWITASETKRRSCRRSSRAFCASSGRRSTIPSALSGSSARTARRAADRKKPVKPSTKTRTKSRKKPKTKSTKTQTKIRRKPKPIPGKTLTLTLTLIVTLKVTLKVKVPLRVKGSVRESRALPRDTPLTNSLRLFFSPGMPQRCGSRNTMPSVRTQKPSASRKKQTVFPIWFYAIHRRGISTSLPTTSFSPSNQTLGGRVGSGGGSGTGVGRSVSSHASSGL